MITDDINWSKVGGLIPAIIQDAHTRKVLMMGYMNMEALELTLSSDKVTFYSRSRQSLWVKGETSGNYLNVVSIKLDCDGDTLLIQVRPNGPTCHKGDDTCWADLNQGDDFLHQLTTVLRDRLNNPKEGSYTNALAQKGIHKIAQKVGEEAVELVIEALRSDKELFLGEAADLMYHLLLLIEAKGYKFDEVLQTLRSRHN